MSATDSSKSKTSNLFDYVMSCSQLYQNVSQNESLVIPNILRHCPIEDSKKNSAVTVEGIFLESG
jgi:hypothetical protein